MSAAAVALVVTGVLLGLLVPLTVWPWLCVAGLAVFVTGALFVPRRR